MTTTERTRLIGSDAADRGDVYERLREDLVGGAMAPREKLMPRRLAPRYSASTASLREALLRLSAEGFVLSAPQRGFRAVAPTPGPCGRSPITASSSRPRARGSRSSVETWRGRRT